MKLRDFLRRRIRHKEIGWLEFKEDFTRYQLIKTRWFNIYLHYLYAPIREPQCHDHPWWFITFLIWPGYVEQIGNKDHRRWPGMILYRPLGFTHTVMTPFGPSWSLVLTGPKRHEWGFKECD